MELEALQNRVEKFNALGADLIAISPQITKFSRTLKKSKKLTFQILGDPGNLVAGQFGLVHTVPEYLRSIYLQFGIDLPRYNADDSWTLPLASRFIIDRQAVIRYAETDTDYRVRPEPEHTLEALEALI